MRDADSQDHGPTMLTGWAAICRETGFSPNTLRKLMREEGFPVQYLGRTPVVTMAQVARWLKARWERSSQARTAGTG